MGKPVKLYGMYSTLFRKTERFTPEVREKVLRTIFSENDDFLSIPEAMNFIDVMISYFEYRALGLQHGLDFIFLDSRCPVVAKTPLFPSFDVMMITDDDESRDIGSGLFMCKVDFPEADEALVNEWYELDEDIAKNYEAALKENCPKCWKKIRQPWLYRVLGFLKRFRPNSS